MTDLLLVGATGLVGQSVLRQALADSRVAKFVAVTRKPLPPHPSLENPLVDFDALPADAPGGRWMEAFAPWAPPCARRVRIWPSAKWMSIIPWPWPNCCASTARRALPLTPPLAPIPKRGLFICE